MLHRLKNERNPLPTVAIIDSQTLNNSATATQQVGFDGGKLIKGRKRFLIVDTMGHLLWTEVRAANVHDGKAGVGLWEQAQLLNPVLESLSRVHADSSFGGHFKEQLETIFNIEVVISDTPVEKQNLDFKLVIHKWPGPPVRLDCRTHD